MDVLVSLTGIGVQVDLLVLDRLPGALHEDVIARTALPSKRMAFSFEPSSEG